MFEETFQCKQCGKEKPVSQRLSRRRICKRCKYDNVEAWRNKNYDHRRKVERVYNAEVGVTMNRERRRSAIYQMLRAARGRALKKGIEFRLVEADLLPLPTHCPILGLALGSFDEVRPNSYSLDRLDPSKGYVPGNVVVMSQRANTLKNNATPTELRKVLDFVLRHSCYTPPAPRVVAQAGIEPARKGQAGEVVADGCSPE